MKTFRYSTVSDFHKCPRYFELKHILGHDDGSDLAGEMTFGTGIHLAIQDLFQEGNGLDVFNHFWSLQKDKALVYSVYNRMDHEAHSKLAKALIEIFADEHRAKFKPLHLERTMKGAIGGHAFSGTADFIGEYEGELSLVDWKTASQPYDDFKLQHNEQIYGYIELAQQDLGMALKRGVYGVAVKDRARPRWQFKSATVTEAKLNDVRANITAVCNDIIAKRSGGVFAKNPNQCVMGKRPCAFFNICHGGAKDGGAGKEEEEST